MRNGFGLMYIYKFLNIPFLHLQCSNLIEALVANRQAFSNISQQLDSAEENQEAICSYDKWVLNFGSEFHWTLFGIKGEIGVKWRFGCIMVSSVDVLF